MNALVQKFAAGILRGVLSGFDRLVFRGTLRNLSYAAGLQHYLWANGVPFKRFREHSQEITQRLIDASQQAAVDHQREIRYLPCNSASKEDMARAIAARDGIRDGLVCVLRCVEPCMGFQIHKSRHTGRLEIRYRQRQCLHLYHYQIHPQFGWLHTRIQTWFPFRVQVCLNGREWLARQLDQFGLAYQRRDNCFPWVEDLARAQALLEEQTRIAWPEHLTALARAVNPLHEPMFAKYPTDYYWSLYQSEWATDVLFRCRAAVKTVYARLVRHGITTYGAGDVLRFLGKRVNGDGSIPQRFAGEVVSDVKECREGVRLKHSVDGNSVKTYDKGSVLRVETTINHPEGFQVYRPAEGDPEGDKAWRPMRRGVADIPRRAEVCQAVNERYLEAAAAVTDATPLQQLAAPLCRRAPAPVSARAKAAGTPRRKVRALNPLAPDDAALLEAVSRPAFVLRGLRNRDLCRLLYPQEARTLAERRRRSAAVTRQLRLLRGHGLLHKVPKTHRYLVSRHGRVAITALLAARDANADQLTAKAA
jgi:hypothetical protein